MNEAVGSARRPRYREILGVLRERIAAGVYPVGGNLPSEAQLCREFAASRFTVREALRRLQADGVLERQQGAGSTVRRAMGAGAFVQSSESVEEILRFAHETDFALVSAESAEIGPELAASLVAEAGERWVRLCGLRLERPSGRPLALIESYVPPRMVQHVAELKAARPPFYSLLEARSGESVVGVLQEVQALAMPSRVARALGLAPATISLRILRRYESLEGTLIASYNWHLGGDRFVYRSRLQPRTLD